MKNTNQIFLLPYHNGCLKISFQPESPSNEASGVWNQYNQLGNQPSLEVNNGNIGDKI